MLNLLNDDEVMNVSFPAVSFPPDIMDTGTAAETLAAEDLLQQLSHELGLPDFMEEDSSSAFSDHLIADPFSVEGRTNGLVPTVTILEHFYCRTFR